jgi:hypothetical protein
MEAAGEGEVERFVPDRMIDPFGGILSATDDRNHHLAVLFAPTISIASPLVAGMLFSKASSRE